MRAFYTVTLTTMLAFSTLIYFAFRNCFNPAAHKRHILIATIAILDAAFQRWHVLAAWGGARGSAPMYHPVALIDNGLRLLVQGRGSSRYVLGQRIRGRAAAGAGSNRAFHTLGGFCRLGADSCAFFAHL